MTMLEAPITHRLRKDEPQVLRPFDRSTPKMTIGRVASMIQTVKRKFQSLKSRRRRAPIEPKTNPRTSLQK